MKVPTVSRAALALLLTASAANALSADSTTARRYELLRGGYGYDLVVEKRPTPTPGPDQVLVRMRAVSLNHRDLYMLEASPNQNRTGLVPVSDGAGEVIGVGTNVTRFKIGDRVATTFFERWTDGDATPAALATARGGQVSGVLSEVIASHQDGLVKFPEHLSFEEAATLPCAGVTAWRSLFKAAQLRPGQFVLLEGTGGVSIFGLQFAAAAGAKPIITSSSDAKLERARALGAAGLINYRTHPDWEIEVRKLTDGRGVDHVLEVGGKETLPRAIKSLASGGHIARIGGLTGFDAQIPAGALKDVQGSATQIYVGSRADFEAMNDFIAKHKLKPVIDKVFPFEDAKAAFEYLESGSHFGKVVIQLK
jgi:NADPH:quinone reductase-like Zn-dependent oxidoreductase